MKKIRNERHIQGNNAKMDLASLHKVFKNVDASLKTHERGTNHLNFGNDMYCHFKLLLAV